MSRSLIRMSLPRYARYVAMIRSRWSVRIVGSGLVMIVGGAGISVLLRILAKSVMMMRLSRRGVAGNLRDIVIRWRYVGF